ncbi:MAG: beta-lactamase-like protein [Benjaminiella poitrasii]|nr:MAG: beta-lactamase-like protein [Benjaminiella poitrasii]
MTSELNHQQDSQQLKQHIKVHKYPLIKVDKIYKYLFQQIQTLPDYITFTDLENNQIIEVDENTHILVLHTPGHARDHCAFYLKEEGVMFTADCILGHGSVAFEDLTEYIRSLHKIKASEPSRLFPGHGEVVNNAMEKIGQYLSLRMAKENQILDLMLRDINVTWTPIEIVEAINLEANKEYSEQLMAVVVRTVGLHLIKLHYDGKVEMVDAENFKQEARIDPYDADNVFRIVNQKWRYIGDEMTSSKL